MAEVQARLMCNPAVPGQVKMYTLGDRTMEHIKPLAEEISRKIVSSYQPINPLNNKTVALRHLPEIMARTGLVADRTSLTDSLLRNLLKLQDFAALHTLFAQHPQLKGNYYLLQCVDPSQDAMKLIHLLEALLTCSQLTGSILLKLYGTQLFDLDLSFDSLIKICKLSPETSVKLAKHHSDKIVDFDQFVTVLKLIPIRQQLEYAITQMDKITDTSQRDQVFRLLSENDGDQFIAAFNHKREKMNNGLGSNGFFAHAVPTQPQLPRPLGQP